MVKASGASPYIEVFLKHVSLRRAGRTVLDDINWRVRPGERWVLAGPNGSGKTQLLKLLGGIVWPTPLARSVRRYLLRGEVSDSPQLVKEEIAYLGAERQDKYDRYGWNTSVARVVGTGIYRSDIPLDVLTATDRRRIHAVLKRFAVSHLAPRPFLSLSYGERRVVLIARALISRPKLLLLDEVLNGLDETHSRRVTDWLAKQTGQLPWVFATHRMDEVPSSVTHALLLEAGRIAYAGPFRVAPLTGKSAWLYRAIGDRKSRASGAAPVHGSNGRAERQARPRRSHSGRVLVRLSKASVHLGERPVLKRISLTVREGEFWLVHGPNGSGKTTLLRTLYGDHGVAIGGSVDRAGAGSGVPLEHFRSRTGLVAPHLQAEHPRELHVAEVVQSGRHASIGLNDRPSRVDRSAASRALRRFGLKGLERRPLHRMSYGQLRRVLFARAFVNAPRLVVLDEPFAGLDPSTRRALMERVREAHARGAAVVVSAHAPGEWRAHATHEIELANGRARRCVAVRSGK